MAIVLQTDYPNHWPDCLANTLPLPATVDMMESLIEIDCQTSQIDWHFMAGLGRLLQIVGLIVPPLAIILQLQNAISLGQMLIMTIAAVSAFWIGRIVEGYARQ